MAGYLFGGNTGVSSAAELARKREIVNALIDPSMTMPQDFGEGLTVFGRALGGKFKDKKLGKQEDAERARVGSQFSAITGALMPQPSASGGSASGGGVRGGPMIPPDPNSPERLGLDAMSALGKAPAGLDEFNASLARTESGGNYNAANSEGYVGKYQFGQGRLDDYNRATGQNIDLATFKANPDLQERVQAWHVGDIDANLGDLYGTSIGGKVMDANAVRAMAHLGGIGGARKFLTSGGAYDPADSNGTNLSDYANTHGKGQMPQIANPDIVAQLSELASNPYATEAQKAIVAQLMGQQMDAMKPQDPMKAIELEKAQLELGALRDPQAKPVDPTSGMQEYEMARQQGYQGTFMDYKAAISANSGTNVTVNNGGTGEPNDSALRKKLMEGEGQLWSDYLNTGTVSAGTQQDMSILDELIPMVPSGPIQGRLAEAFPGFSSAGDAFQSVVKRVAPTLRAPGSGATSDIEYDGMLRSLPALRNNPEANAAISGMMKAKSQINMERAAIIQQYQNGQGPDGQAFTAADARKAMAEIDKRSIMTPQLQALIGNLDGATPEEGAPPSVDASSPDFQAFAADPSANAAAEKYGVTIEEMWALKQGLK